MALDTFRGVPRCILVQHSTAQTCFVFPTCLSQAAAAWVALAKLERHAKNLASAHTKLAGAQEELDKADKHLGGPPCDHAILIPLRMAIHRTPVHGRARFTKKRVHFACKVLQL